MKFGTLVRGMGKIYIDLVGELPEGGMLSCRSATAKGSIVPSAIAEKRAPQKGFIAVIPILTVKQTVTVEVSIASVGVVESISTEVRPLRAAIESKRNSFTKSASAEQTRDADLQMNAHETWVHVDRIIFDDGLAVGDNPERADVVRLTAKVLVLDGESASAAPHVTVCDRRGKVLPVENVTVLFDEASETAAGSMRMRTLGLSFRKPMGSQFFVDVSFEGGRLPSGFVFVDDYYDDRVRWTCWGKYDPSGDGARYHDWFVEHHRATGQELALQRQTTFPYEPLFSIIVPLFETPLEYFREMVESVLCQTYGNLELILVNASPDNEQLRKEVETYQRCDGRVVARMLDENRGITLNTHAGIEISKGDFVCFFDHDDVIEPDLLFEYVKGINAFPDTDMLYCDEDKLLDGWRLEGALMKPDYDRTLILACNMVTHMLTVRRAIIEGFDELADKKYDGSQDHNLTLRVAEVARTIYHVRKVRYHWRLHSNSTSQNMDSKPWAVESGRVAVAEHLDRIGVEAAVSNAPHFPNCYLVDYGIPSPQPYVTVVLAAKSVHETRRCLASVCKHACYENLEIIVAWRGEQADLAQLCESEGLQNVRSMSWAEGESVFEAYNRAADMALGEFLVFLDQGIEALSPQWVRLMVGPLMRQGNGACGPKLLYVDDLLRQVGLVMAHDMPIRLGEYIPRNSTSGYVLLRFARQVAAVESNCMAVSRLAFDQVGGFDSNFFTEWGSFDFCFKLSDAGYDVVAEPRAEFYCHLSTEGNQAKTFGSASRHASTVERVRYSCERGMLMSRWPNRFGKPDHCYNVNFTSGPQTFALEYPVDSMSVGLE